MHFLRSSSQTPGIDLTRIGFVFADHIAYQHSYQQRLAGFATREASEVAVFTRAASIFLRLRYPSLSVATIRADDLQGACC
jgi:hypothetical protein